MTTAARWAAKAIRTIESVKTVVLYHDGKTILEKASLVARGTSTPASRIVLGRFTNYCRDVRAGPTSRAGARRFWVSAQNAQSALIQPFSMVVLLSRATASAHCRRATWRRYASSRGGSGSGLVMVCSMSVVSRVDGVRAGMQPFLVCADRGSPRAQRAAAPHGCS